MPVSDDLDILLASVDGELSDQDLQMIKLGRANPEEIKAKLKLKKSSIPLDMPDTANTMTKLQCYECWPRMIRPSSKQH